MKNDRYCGENWLDEATKEACEKIGSTYTLEGEPIEFSPGHRRRMLRLFGEAPRSVAYRPFKAVGRVACMLVACTAIMGTAMFGVNAWRSRFLVFDFDKDAPGTAFYYGGMPKQGYFDDNISLGYIPDGMECIISDSSYDVITVYFMNENNECLIIGINPAYMKVTIDTEGGTYEYVTVDGCEAVYFETPKNMNTVLWYKDSMCFTVQGNFSKDILMRVAENVNK